MLLRKLLWTGLDTALGACATMAARCAASGIWDRDRRRACGEEMNESERKLRPRLIAARARRRNPEAAAPRAAQLSPRRNGSDAAAGGPHPLLVVGAALVVGIAIAKVIDWRGHAHPRV